jgi:hypothetical protein
VAFLQGYYEGGNWGFVEVATGRYETSGDAAGTLSWADDGTVVTVGAFYGEPGSVRRATLDQLPASSVVDTGGGERRDHSSGVLSPDGKLLALVFKEPSDPATERAARVGRIFASGGALEAVDTDGDKLTAGFDDHARLVWIERSAGSPMFLRHGIEPAALPADLSLFHRLTPVGPGTVGVAAERSKTCDPPSCQGRPPPFERRYLVIDVEDGAVVWQSPAFGATTGFAGVVR